MIDGGNGLTMFGAHCPFNPLFQLAESKVQSQWEYEDSDTKFMNDLDARIFKVWDLSNGKIIATIFMDSGKSDFAISPDGLTIAAGDVLGQVHFLRLEGTEKRLPEEGKTKQSV